jgi:hypothetical protein
VTARVLWVIWSMIWAAGFSAAALAERPRRVCIVEQLAPPGCMQWGQSGSQVVSLAFLAVALLPLLASPAIFALIRPPR